MLLLQRNYKNITQILKCEKIQQKGLTNKPFFVTIVLSIFIKKGEKNGYILYS